MYGTCVRPESLSFLWEKQPDSHGNSADSFCQKYPKCLKHFQPNLAAQTQKFGFFEGKAIARWVSVVRILTNSMSYKVKNNLKFKET